MEQDKSTARFTVLICPSGRWDRHPFAGSDITKKVGQYSLKMSAAKARREYAP